MSETARHVVDVVRDADPDRYLAALYAPAERREDLFALYAFNVEIASVRDRVSDALPGEIRLQWWRDVLAGGEGPEAAQGHPVAEALLKTIEQHHLPVETFLNYLDARIFDLYDDAMPSRTDLEGYCGETASAIIQLAAMVLDPPMAAQTASLAGHAGCAQAIAGLLRLLPIHRARGQCYLPADILSAAGTTRETVLVGEDRDGIARAVGAMSALGREHLEAFEGHAPALPPTLRPAYLPVALAGPYLDRVDRRPFEAANAVAEISAVRRHMRLFVTAARGWR